MKEFWFIFGLGLLIYLYLIFVGEKHELLSILPIYSLIGVFAYSFEKKYLRKKYRVVEIEE
ncbi:MAG: hypothetical protein QXP52_02415 [Candidatus Aenigmatarchaeota archaeon]